MARPVSRFHINPTSDAVEDAVRRGVHVGAPQLLEALKWLERDPLPPDEMASLLDFVDLGVAKCRGRPAKGQITARHLAQKLRVSADSGLPAVTLEHLCAFLEGTSRQPRGRPLPDYPVVIERQRMLSHARWLYRIFLARCQAGDPPRGRVRAALRQRRDLADMPPSKLAMAMTWAYLNEFWGYRPPSEATLRNQLARLRL